MAVENKFIVTDIPGPNVLKKVLGELGYSPAQIKEVDGLTPLMFPMYVYENPQTRYWRGSNPGMIGSFSKKINWVDYLLSIKKITGKDQCIDVLESDLQWLRGKMETVVGQLKQTLGSY